MSRSKRKTPIIAIAGVSEKKDKQLANRKFRKLAKNKISVQEYEDLPEDLKDVSNVWTFNKDGKIYMKKDVFDSEFNRKMNK